MIPVLLIILFALTCFGIVFYMFQNENHFKIKDTDSLTHLERGWIDVEIHKRPNEDPRAIEGRHSV